MSDIPKVWWLPGEGLLAIQRGSDFIMPTGGWQAVPDPVRRPLLDKGFPLVPQASRDELREAIADTVAYLVEDMREVDIADAIVDVLTERGHVARPEGGEQRG